MNQSTLPVEDQRETRHQAYDTVGGKPKARKSYTRYHKMLARCYNPKNLMYHRYGGRGIKVCDRWLGEGGYTRFMDDMGECPDPSLSIDRIDNNGDYSPENCRWADRLTQNRNTGRNRLVEIDGISKCIEEWASVSGISSHCIAKRLKRGWGAREAVFTPEQSGVGHSKRRRRDHGSQAGVSQVYARGRKDFVIPNPPDHVQELQGPYLQIGTREKLLFVDGVCKPFGLWMRGVDVPKDVVKDRLKRGWSDKDALLTPALGVGQKRPGIRRATPPSSHSSQSGSAPPSCGPIDPSAPRIHEALGTP